MRVVVQRCSRAVVRVDGTVCGKIDKGFVLLVGVSATDTRAEADWIVRKIAHLRVFEDAAGKMNLSLNDVGGSILSISQFTLYGDCRKGNRPSFINAARPDAAASLYYYFNRSLRDDYHLHVETGRFGADMKVDFINDGPVTIILDTDELTEKESVRPLPQETAQSVTQEQPIQKAPQPAPLIRVDSRVQKMVRAIGKQSLPRRQILAELGLKQTSRKSFIDNYLKPTYALGYINFAYPASPNKPEQACRLTAKGLELYNQLTKENT